MTKIAWTKIKLSAEEERIIESVLPEVNQATQKSFHLVRQLFNRLAGYRKDDLLFVRIGTGRRPPEVETLAINVGDATHWYLPSHVPEHFEACCAALGISTDTEKDAFVSFVDPKAPASRHNRWNAK